MKFWMKIFLFTLLLFIFISYFSIFLISRLSYQNNLNTARDQAFSQHEFISADVSESVRAIIERNDPWNLPNALYSLMNYYGGHYGKKGIYLGLEKEGKPLFSGLPVQTPEELQNISGQRKSVVVSMDEQKYIFISGAIVDGYALVYAQNITHLVESQSRLTRQLLTIEILAVLLFGILSFFLSKRLTEPIVRLEQVAKRIRGGELTIRSEVTGHDEIAALAVSFNEMADEVVSRIAENEAVALQKQQFIDNLAHELKTPLTAVKGHAELLQSVKSSEDERLRSTAHILSNVDRIQRMSQKLLTLALNRDMAITLQPVSVGELFERVHDEFTSTLAEKDMALSLSCDIDIIHGDAVLLQNLIGNLLDNAIRASDAGQTITLKAYEEDVSPVIEITDEGVGIPEKDIANVFEPFYRVDFSRSNKNKSNAGLGLALCKQIADAHGAKIEIQSAVGQGTSIKIIFKKAFYNSATTL